MNEKFKEIGKAAGFVFIDSGVYGQRWYSSKCGLDLSEFEQFTKLVWEEAYQQGLGNRAERVILKERE
jgi:hypothetical protein